MKAERALEFGDPAEASVHAWNALETIDAVEAGRLRRVAEELADAALIDALERRGLEKQGSHDEKPFRLRKLVPLLAIVLVWLAIAAHDLVLSETDAPKMEEARVAMVMPQASPLVTERDGIWLVRIGNVELFPLEKLAVDLTHRFDLPVGVLPAVDPLPESAIDEVERLHGEPGHELDGDELLSLLASFYGAQRRATIIGVTDFRMHGRDRSRRPYMLRDHRHYAVISTADLGAVLFDRLHGHTRYERTRKLAGRAIGFLYFRLPESSDRHSLVRSEMSGTHDIDALRERL